MLYFLTFNYLFPFNYFLIYFCINTSNSVLLNDLEIQWLRPAPITSFATSSGLKKVDLQ